MKPKLDSPKLCVIRQWDDSTEVVAALGIDKNTVAILYPDDTCHHVPRHEFERALVGEILEA